MSLEDTALSVGFLAAFWYLIEAYLFSRRFQKNDPAAWTQIGSPRLTDINGVVRYVMIFVGMTSLDRAVLERYASRIFRIRFLLVAGLMAFLLVSFRPLFA